MYFLVIKHNKVSGLKLFLNTQLVVSDKKCEKIRLRKYVHILK